jgi:hypothetical protein
VRRSRRPTRRPSRRGTPTIPPGRRRGGPRVRPSRGPSPRASRSPAPRPGRWVSRGPRLMRAGISITREPLGSLFF